MDIFDSGKQGLILQEADGICRARRFMEKYFFRDITLKLAAEAACMSKYHFCRLFKQQVGMSYCGYLQRLRIKKAKELLANGGDSVTLVCDMVGYSDLTHFERVFRKITGIPPMVYRKQVKNVAD